MPPKTDDALNTYEYSEAGRTHHVTLCFAVKSQSLKLETLGFIPQG